MLRSMTALFCGFCLLTAPWAISPTSAAVHDGQDVLGLATRPDHTGEFELADQDVGIIELHLVVYGWNHGAGLTGWACRLDLPPNLTIVGLRPVGAPLWIVQESPELRWLFRQPLYPVDGLLHLGSIRLVSTSAVPRSIGLSSHPGVAVEGLGGFRLETDKQICRSFNWPGNCPECPVFEFSYAPQPVSDVSWSGIKSLYR